MSNQLSIQYICDIKGGKLLIRNRPALDKMLANMPDGEYVFSIKELKNYRSEKQNRYYWGVVIRILADNFGYTPMEIHEALKSTLLPKEFEFATMKITSSRSTTSLNTSEFEDYLEKVRIWANQEFGVIIPLPNEVALPDYY